MKKEREQIIIIGLGKFGMTVAKELSSYDCDVLAVDESQELVAEVAPFVTHAVSLNAIDENALLNIGAKNFDVAIIGIGDNIESSIMISLTLKELGIPHIIAKSRDDKHSKLLAMIGVEKVVQPEHDSAVRLVKNIMHKHLVERLEFSKDYSIVEIEAPDKWFGRRLNDLALRQKHQMNVICIKKNEEGNTIFPSAEYQIVDGDNLMVVAPNTEIEKMPEWI